MDLFALGLYHLFVSCTIIIFKWFKYLVALFLKTQVLEITFQKKNVKKIFKCKRNNEF